MPAWDFILKLALTALVAWWICDGELWIKARSDNESLGRFRQSVDRYRNPVIFWIYASLLCAVVVWVWVR
jgi:hypothetical protein